MFIVLARMLGQSGVPLRDIQFWHCEQSLLVIEAYASSFKGAWQKQVVMLALDLCEALEDKGDARNMWFKASK